ncbi:MAG: TrmH family RNA methyltransferase, partial [Actinomycetota bacterium]
LARGPPSLPVITSLRNSHIRGAIRLRKRGMRDRDREFLVEGVTGIGEAFSSGLPVRVLFVEVERKGAPTRSPKVAGLAARCPGRVLEVSPPVMHALSAATTPPGAVAVSPFVDLDPERLLERRIHLALVLVEVRDPGNLGTILRTAWAGGVDAVFLGEGTVDAYNSKCVRAAAGALFHVPFARRVAIPWLLAELGSRGIRRIMATPRSQTFYDQIDMTGPSALVFGNEAWGLGEDVEAWADERASIPMAGPVESRADSLNVALSVAVFLFEAARQRRGA